jgi:hypothetical protein
VPTFLTEHKRETFQRFLGPRGPHKNPHKLDDSITFKMVSKSGLLTVCSKPPASEAVAALAVALPTLISLIKSKSDLIRV